MSALTILPSDDPPAGTGPPGPARRTGRDGQPLAHRRMVLLIASPPEADHLIRAWAGQGIDVRACDTLTAGLLLIGRHSPDAVVIGGAAGAVGLVDFLHTLQTQDTTAPVIVGLDNTQRDQGVDALAAGATAIVRRPFNAEDLLRIISFTDPAGQPVPVRPLPIELGGRLRIDGVCPRMWLDGTESLLPPMEYQLLRYLAARSGEILSRAELIEAVWGEDRTSNTLTVHLARLRRRLEGTDGTDWIRPVRGYGYQFLVPQTPTPPTTPHEHPGRAARREPAGSSHRIRRTR